MLSLLISALFYSLNSFAWKIYLASYDRIQLIWGRAIFTTLIALAYYLITERNTLGVIHAYNNDGVNFILASTFGFCGLFFLTKGLKNSSLSSFAIYIALISIISGIGTSIIETINVETFIGSAFIFVGCGFSINWRSIKPFNQDHISLVIMATCFIISGFLYWPIVEKYPPIYTVLAQEFFVFIIFSVFLLIRKSLMSSIAFFFKEIKTLFLFSLLIFLAVYFGLNGLKTTNPFLLSLSGLLSPILSILLGILFLKEKLTWKILASVILLFLGSTVLHFQYG
jgi:drug/metabolite transporter (DMT)-like permease